MSVQRPDSDSFAAPAFADLLREMRAVRKSIQETIRSIEDEVDIVAAVRLLDWLKPEEAISFMVSDAPAMLVAGFQEGAIKPGTILFAVREMHRLFRYLPAHGNEPGELTGAHVNRLVPPHLRKAHAEHMAGFFAKPERKPMSMRMENLPALTKDNHAFPVRIALRPRKFNGRLIVLVTIVQVGPKEQYIPPPGVDQTKSWSDTPALKEPKETTAGAA